MTKYELEQLPYSYNALEPYIDEQTMKIHHDKHHQAYVDKLNAALEKHPDLQNKTVIELLKDLNKVPQDIRTAVKNHGGGTWNHTFFWKVLKKDVKISGEIAKAIDKKFGSFEKFKEEFGKAAAEQFGSGWAWLVVNKEGKLEIMSTSNQNSPLSIGKKPILAIDVWEHAYYLRYQNRRAEYITAFWNVVNWQQVEKNYLATLKN
ncbi:MAG: superoxide dismutase [Nanoarchaeota archaeon]|nr:superoxide dismutase [Nanoarchaeota archaeon]MBU1270068.1 superoxide dismutase [Nanoarchaeota archaeon]MBU1605003.1 superoxide dismutase [Nanoarchaeota archaeon]MBU2443404.1 superoxide dismutase [Nanoarchaeota archaeon]